MEQGAKSPSASSDQEKQLQNELTLTHEVNPIVHSSPQEHPAEKELSCRFQTSQVSKRDNALIPTDHVTPRNACYNELVNIYNLPPIDFSLLASSSKLQGEHIGPSQTLRKMIWQDEKTPNYRSWNSSARGYQRYSSSNIDTHGGRYTLYDKRYEAIGLPVDPHLRIFNATNGNGNKESSKKIN
ncbi:hypothetical protein Pfo_015742 [Paulownia fortunei]|nr:hypothetical protein Pfo_015742 [Paulownia fortunei]